MQELNNSPLTVQDWYNDFALEVKLVNDNVFLPIVETLRRIGITKRDEKGKLFQLCHIFTKRGKYYIVHYKELCALDGEDTTISKNDIGRRNRIAALLVEWGMITIPAEDYIENMVPVSWIKILKYSQKDEYELVPNYHIGSGK